MQENSHIAASSTITLPLSLMHFKFTEWRTLARSLYVLLKLDQCDNSCKLAHKNIYKLQKHKMTHTGEKAHKCHQYLPCVHTPSFKIQMRTHMGEMYYKCSQCNYTCTQVTNLHRHKLTHTDVRAFNCDQCIKYSHEKVISKSILYFRLRYKNTKSPHFYEISLVWLSTENLWCSLSLGGLSET